MLPKTSRIKRKDFSHILKNSQRYISDNLILYVEKNDEKEKSKFAFSVSKKIKKLAVDRNLYRRRGYAALQKKLNYLKPGYFAFFSYKNIPRSLSFKKIEIEIENLLKQAGMLESIH